MAYDSVRAQLDQILGTDRDGGFTGVVSIRTKARSASSGPRTLQYWDPTVCKHFLCAGFCPNKLFSNTKADLGACTKIHSDDLRAIYTATTPPPPLPPHSVPHPNYERDLRALCAEMVADVDRRIGRAVKRLQTQYGVVGGGPAVAARMVVPSVKAMRAVARAVRGDEIDKDDDDDEDAEAREGHQSGSESDDDLAPVQDATAGAANGDAAGIRVLSDTAPAIKILGSTDGAKHGDNGPPAPSSDAPPAPPTPASEPPPVEPKQEPLVQEKKLVVEVDQKPATEPSPPAPQPDESKGDVAPPSEPQETKKPEPTLDEKPRQDTEPQQVQPPPAAPPPTFKKWREYKTPEGKVYWHDAQAGVSTWEKPPEEDIDRPAPPPGGDAYEMEEGEEPEPQDPLMEKRNKLRVCEVCGAFLSIFDSERRLNDHFTGKMHLGYVKLREELSRRRIPPRFAPSNSSDGRGRDREDDDPRRMSRKRERSDPMPPMRGPHMGAYDRRPVDFERRGDHFRGGPPRRRSRSRDRDRDRDRGWGRGGGMGRRY